MTKFLKSDIQAMEQRYRAHFVNSLSGFKSANLIGTRSNAGQSNLCIVSSAFHLGADPALMGFIVRPDVAPRHTLDNIRENSFFTLNHVNATIWKKAHQTSARYERKESEFDKCGLHEKYIENFHAPFVKESHLKVGLKMLREETLPENGTHFIVASVELVQIDDSAIREDGFVDVEELATVVVSGLDCYHTTQKLGRLSYAKPDKAPIILP